MLSSVPMLRNFLHAIKNDADRQLCQEVIEAFDKEVLPIEHIMEKVSFQIRV